MDNNNLEYKDIVSTQWLNVNEEALYWPKKRKADILKIDINQVDIYPIIENRWRSEVALFKLFIRLLIGRIEIDYSIIFKFIIKIAIHYQYCTQ